MSEEGIKRLTSICEDIEALVGVWNRICIKGICSASAKDGPWISGGR
jgi:hypothetical protein